MGGKFSKLLRGKSSSWAASLYTPSPRHSSSYASSCEFLSHTYGPANVKNKLQRRYSHIADNYSSLDQVTEALAQAGLESSNLIVGIDFTKSNEWTGAKSFNRQCLHRIGDSLNPYEQAISIIGRTLSSFDEDNMIPCFGFGDASTHDQHVFSFCPGQRPCNGFEEALECYRDLVPHLRLAGPTSFAPIIEAATSIVEESGGQYHVLLIIADGQVTRSVDTGHGYLSPQEQSTINAIVEASKYPLSIVMVGVGDGPWDMMREFDDNIPARAFDNFQFVNFTEIMSKNAPLYKKETEFALAALMEIPSQYKATLDLHILGRRNGKTHNSVPLPPPRGVNCSTATPCYPRSDSFQSCGSQTFDYVSYSGRASPAVHNSQDVQMCPVCLVSPKNLAFGCGHQTCYDCGQYMAVCPMCRSEVTTKIRLY